MFNRSKGINHMFCENIYCKTKYIERETGESGFRRYEQSGRKEDRVRS